MSIIAKLETGLTPNWLRDQLEQNGPWHNKTNERDKVNCLLRFHKWMVPLRASTVEPV